MRRNEVVMLRRVEGWHGSLGSSGRRLGSWWFGELRGLLPAPLRAALVRGRQYIRLDVDDTSVDAVFESPLEREHLGTFSVHDERERSKLRRLLRYPAERVLCLPAGRVLRRRIELPLATEENLREVLGFELDRYTPFTAEQACYDYRLLQRDVANRQVILELVAVLRTTLADANRQLQTLGVPVHRASTVTEDGALLDVNLLPSHERARITRIPRLVNTALFCIALGLLGLAVGLPWYQKNTQLDVLQPLVQQARAEAARVRTSREQLASLSDEAYYVLERYRATIPSLAIINEVTRVLPDDTWARQLIVQDGEVQITGESANAASLVQLLESSPLFHSVRFRSPVVEDRRSDVERFNLSAEFGAERDP